MAGSMWRMKKRINIIGSVAMTFLAALVAVMAYGGKRYLSRDLLAFRQRLLKPSQAWRKYPSSIGVAMYNVTISVSSGW